MLVMDNEAQERLFGFISFMNGRNRINFIYKDKYAVREVIENMGLREFLDKSESILKSTGDYERYIKETKNHHLYIKNGDSLGYKSGYINDFVFFIHINWILNNTLSDGAQIRITNVW